MSKRSEKISIRDIKDHFDTGSLIVIAITFVLFVAALFTKGFTHELLLEAGVFLISVKLILMVYKNKEDIDSIHDKLDLILRKMDEKNEIEIEHL